MKEKKSDPPSKTTASAEKKLIPKTQHHAHEEHHHRRAEPTEVDVSLRHDSDTDRNGVQVPFGGDPVSYLVKLVGFVHRRFIGPKKARDQGDRYIGIETAILVWDNSGRLFQHVSRLGQ